MIEAQISIDQVMLRRLKVRCLSLNISNPAILIKQFIEVGIKDFLKVMKEQDSSLEAEGRANIPGPVIHDREANDGNDHGIPVMRYVI